MKKFCFVILHYLAVEDTIECIKSIEDRYMDKYLIDVIVVDNASPDQSGELLDKIYSENSNINILHNKKNLGFSKGNNVGIRYANKKLNADFIIVINNDTILVQDEFLDIIDYNYQVNKFAVLGPMVLDPGGLNTSNPLYIGKKKNSIELKKIYKMWRRLYFKSLFYMDKVHLMKNHVVSDTKDNNSIAKRENLTNIELHGCCLIFSRKYFEYYDGFEELTFMYGEETILKMNCDKYNLIMLYDQNLKIFHKEAISTKKEFTSHKKKLVYNKRMMQASKAIYLKSIRK